MTTILDLDNWARKEHFEFYNKFEEPFFGLTARVECTEAYRLSKENGYSFFLFYLHKALVAVNTIEPFKYRIIDAQVHIYDRVDASPTINRPDGTFGFSYIKYFEDFEEFVVHAQEEITRVQHTKGLDPSTSGQNVIHCSAIPWVDFTSVSHARSFSFPDSCPKIAFGKMTEESGKRSMPVSVHAHHALMDGFHVGQFFELFGRFLAGKS